ncbi:MAG TPA: hypothetical protein VGE27_04775 [Gemmatimonas sp.]|uniref:hypothetical protein n=1 Tax=Gemmatimonas sp. TaxID=1962908 RepID=UPI002EDBB30C
MPGTISNDRRDAGRSAPRILRQSLAAATAMLLLSACAKQAVSTTTNLPGAAPVPSVTNDDPSTFGSSTPKGAIDGFLKAVNAQDLQGMAALWGNTKGLARDQFKREELEKRLIVMQCLIQHDKATYPEDRARLVTGGRQEFLVELTKRGASARTSFTTVQGPGGRWLVEDVDVAKLRDFCR